MIDKRILVKISQDLLEDDGTRHSNMLIKLIETRTVIDFYDFKLTKLADNITIIFSNGDDFVATEFKAIAQIKREAISQISQALKEKANIVRVAINKTMVSIKPILVVVDDFMKQNGIFYMKSQVIAFPSIVVAWWKLVLEQDKQTALSNGYNARLPQQRSILLGSDRRKYE